MNVVLVFLLILVILILFKTTIKSQFAQFDLDTIAQQLYNRKEWDNYRIGDVVLQDPKTSRFYNPKNWENVLYHETKYPGSIASEYIKLNKSIQKQENIELLNQIIKSKNGVLLDNNQNTLYLHIRVGDVICKKVWIDNAPSFYSKQGDTVWWDNVINYIKRNGITTVIIIAGTHFEDCLLESAKYIYDRTLFLEMYGNVKVEHRLGKSPDDDILFISQAKHFITTGGGYGKLLELIINKNKMNN